MNIVIPAKAGISGQEVTAGLHETPAFWVPSKYYFDGVPSGVTANLLLMVVAHG